MPRVGQTRAVVIMGEASESDDDDVADQAQIPPKNANDLNSASKEVVSSSSRKPEASVDHVEAKSHGAGEEKQKASGVRDEKRRSFVPNKYADSKPKYNSLLHKKLRDKCLQVKKDVVSLASAPFLNAQKTLAEVNQDVMKDQLIVQDAAAVLRTVSDRLYQLSELTNAIPPLRYVGIPADAGGPSMRTEFKRSRNIEIVGKIENVHSLSSKDTNNSHTDGNGDSNGSDEKEKPKDEKPSKEEKPPKAKSSGGSGKVVFGSPTYLMYCGIGGILSCGITHTMVVPLDLVKCRLQVDSEKYKNIFHGFRVTVQEEGYVGLSRGWLPTLIGYSVQGLGKFGFYEYFKIKYGELVGEEIAFLYRTSIYLAASASAEFIADIGLSPFEAMKVRIQTSPGFTSSMMECASIISKDEGMGGFYKALVPLWGRQIPYTMMKFACFERTLEALYKYVVPKPREECSKSEQLAVTFTAGYIAGVFCAIVSHPADTVVSKLNKEKGASAMDIAKRLGWAGMWNGLGPRIFMIGTLTALQWFIYDAVKVTLDIPRPPPPAMPESLKKKLGGDS
ncbi:unnamed protein product [Notodromas monacha]|uniref:Phosphate carrier protein, mitochondrial n=1 Tax=Notodromas monacha TaxID=399045 RepID=A0A7R9BFF1_9CRUS|nr:unnamed protein product [Notodromas monacha]CAG0913499.1 unnamed protein product [Notodromas monacha]